MRLLNLVLACGVGSAAMACAETPASRAPSPAAASAERWLGAVDQGRYAEGWDQATAAMRSRWDKAGLGRAIEPARKPLGTLVSRKLSSERAIPPPPGRADGDYEVLEFDSDFTGGRDVTETVLLMHEPSGWKVDGYNMANVDPLFLPYETPGTLAKIPGGPTIHIKCMGAGAPTVVLTAGSGDWGAGWRTIQPEIAKTTRVCAWDRPGFGFSSGSARPQTVLNTVAVLEAALRIARVDGPYVVVGHSRGSYESLLFKDRNPRAVVGMVLVDPSIPDQTRRFAAAAPDVGKYFEPMTARESDRLGRCIGAAKSGRLKPGSRDPDGCLFSPPSYPRALRQALARRNADPLRPTAVKSWTDHGVEDDSLVIRANRNYGDMPLIVLTAMKDQNPPGMPQSAEDELPAQHAEWVRGHDALAALSRRGVNRLVADSSHYIQYDQPKAVIDAIEEVVRAARSAPAVGSAGAVRR
jgi:pimeloyl-ACP methyl ester carboxylesterase